MTRNTALDAQVNCYVAMFGLVSRSHISGVTIDGREGMRGSRFWSVLCLACSLPVAGEHLFAVCCLLLPARTCFALCRVLLAAKGPRTITLSELNMD